MQDMTREEIREFLTSEPRTATLATVRADGRPHAKPIWFTLDGDDVLFTTWYETVTAANLEENNRVSISVDDPTPPYAFVIFEGRATVQKSPDHEEMLRWTTQISGHYMGSDLADSYGQRNAVEGEYLVRVKVDKVVAKRGIAD